MSATLYKCNRVKSGSVNEDPADSDWQQWLEANAPRFLLFARTHVRCEADAQDLVQDAMVEAWRRHQKPIPPPPAIVFSTIRRRAIDLARSDQSRSLRETKVARETSYLWFDSGPEDRERDALLQQAMSKMQDIYRDVVTLKVWGELTFAEISQALDIPANTAASRYRYGLEELRRLTKDTLP
jgi:RNA polymerase sigma-70 factor (ECF subfamily)